jgi:hypothetical protein
VGVRQRHQLEALVVLCEVRQVHHLCDATEADDADAQSSHEAFTFL